MNRKETKKKTFTSNTWILITGALLLGIGVFGLASSLIEYGKATVSYNDLEKGFVKVYDTHINASAASMAWYEMASVDVKGLKADYPDVVGWIYFEDEDISYPIMQGTDNAYYLDHSYDGSQSSAGALFLDTYSAEDYSDFHGIIYGHNMKNLSMFGKLKYYKTKPAYYEEHKYFQIFTESEILRYEIFAYQECPIESVIFNMENPADAGEILREIRYRSMVHSELSVDAEDKILTLSTCTAEDDYRFIVNAVLVDKHSK